MKKKDEIQNNLSQPKPKVTIKKGIDSFWPSFLTLLPRKLQDYTNGIYYSAELAFKYNASENSNAFHDMLINYFNALGDDELKVLELPIFSPSYEKICQRVWVFGNPYILKELLKSKRFENASPKYYEENPELPKIEGARPFKDVLKAIGMGILTEGPDLHDAFIREMIDVLTIGAIDQQTDPNKPHVNQFIKVVLAETHVILTQIENSIQQQKNSVIDFRVYALKIFLKGFYPNGEFEEQWIKDFSKAIEEVSNFAFHAIMNPYSDLEALKEKANKIFEPYINYVMTLDQSYLSKKYLDNLTIQHGPKKSLKIQRQIFISLVVAAADNIKKYFDHIMVEFGKTEIREKYLMSEKIAKSDFADMITEVGRIYPVIYALPGKAGEDFSIVYEEGNFKQSFQIRKNDEIHLTTFQATKDKKAWGEKAEEFDPESHKSKYRELNAEGQFGGGDRPCRGKDITKALIKFLMEKITESYLWVSRVDGLENVHPTEFNFNYGVKGKIELQFSKRETALEFVKKPDSILVKNSLFRPVEQTEEYNVALKHLNNNAF